MGALVSLAVACAADGRGSGEKRVAAAAAAVAAAVAVAGAGVNGSEDGIQLAHTEGEEGADLRQPLLRESRVQTL